MTMKIRMFSATIFAFAILIFCVFFFLESEQSLSANSLNSGDFSKGTTENQTISAQSNHKEIIAEDPGKSSNHLNYGECYVYEEEKERILMRERKDYLFSLSDSSNREEQLAYAIFGISNIYPDYDKEKVVEIQIKKIEALTGLDQNEHPLVALETLRLCSIQFNYPLCDNSLIEKITSLHNNDSEIWLEATNYYLQKGQDERVFSAIKQAKQSQYSSSFYSLFVSTYAETMTKANIGEYNSMVINSLGYYMAKSKPYTAQTNWCKNNLQNAKHAQACLDMGVLMEQSSSDTVDKVIGLAIQRIVYDAESNTKMLAQIKSKENILSPSYSDGRATYSILDTVFQYEALLKNYIDNMAILGEYAALQQIKPEVLSFRKSTHFEDCSK